MNRRGFFARLLQGAAFAVTTHYAPRVLAPIALLLDSRASRARGVFGIYPEGSSVGYESTFTPTFTIKLMDEALAHIPKAGRQVVYCSPSSVRMWKGIATRR